MRPNGIERVLDVKRCRRAWAHQRLQCARLGERKSGCMRVASCWPRRGGVVPSQPNLGVRRNKQLCAFGVGRERGCRYKPDPLRRKRNMDERVVGMCGDVLGTFWGRVGACMGVHGRACA
eukprot:6199965-Pleurochrysis_carterae.AAC.2